MPSNAFCKIEGIEGDSKVAGFENQIELISISLVVGQPTSISVGGQGSLTTSGAQHREFQIVKSIDKASPNLMLYVLNGKHIAKVEVTLSRAAVDKSASYIKYEFADVVISSYALIGGVNGDKLPDESVGFTYGQIKVTYTDS
jgi:type VI secretion system secreted protein Hcp